MLVRGKDPTFVGRGWPTCSTYTTTTLWPMADPGGTGSTGADRAESRAADQAGEEDWSRELEIRGAHGAAAGDRSNLQPFARGR